MTVFLLLAYFLEVGSFLGFMFSYSSTPSHLVITRKAADKAPCAMDVDRVRNLEWELYGRYYTGFDGRPLADDDPAAFGPPHTGYYRLEDKIVAYHAQQVANTRAARPAYQGPAEAIQQTGIFYTGS